MRVAWGVFKVEHRQNALIICVLLLLNGGHVVVSHQSQATIGLYHRRARRANRLGTAMKAELASWVVDPMGT